MTIALDDGRTLTLSLPRADSVEKSAESVRRLLILDSVVIEDDIVA